MRHSRCHRYASRLKSLSFAKPIGHTERIGLLGISLCPISLRFELMRPRCC